MKKYFSLILVVVVIIAMATTVFASEIDPWDESAGSGEIQVTAHLYSHYQISIPATIDLSSGDQCFVTISNASLEDGYAVSVYCTNAEANGITLVNVTDPQSTITCSLLNSETGALCQASDPLVTFAASDINNGSAEKYFRLEVMDKWMRAGDYAGTMQYQFCCKKAE